ncbi:MAG: kelch repeat-containing protein [Bryobacteraceae bacterium]
MRSPLGFLILLLPGPLFAQAPDWNLAFTQASVSRWSMNMAFDSGRQVTVMFGGRDQSNTIPFSDTYEYASTGWNQVFTLHSPPARFWAAMAYDEHRRRIVLFGGQGGQGPVFSTHFNDTWEYDGNDWTSIPTVHSPVAQAALSMTYDSCRQKTVLFDRQGATWEYAGGDWTQVTTSTVPPARNLAALVFNPGRCRVMLFGGLPEVGPLNGLSDTWEYDGTNWIEINTGISPPGRWGHVMVFDTNRARAVVFGGYGPIYPSGQETNDTWEYDGNTWVQVFPAHSPGPEPQRAMVYDPARARGVMFGGAGNPGEAWEYTTITPCTYSISPSGQSFGPQGGVGSFAVNTGPTCTWNPIPSGTWIMILPSGSKGTGKVNYVVAANSGGSPRNGFITAGGQQFNISQQGFSCTYQINPAVAAFNNTGGNFRVTVTAPTGCSWTAASNAGWIGVASGASGSGSGIVTLNTQPNSGGPRSGTATIAGSTFSATQGAGVCGALDVTSQIGVSRSGLTFIYPSSYLYSGGISVTNNSGSVVRGPVWIALIGLPTHYGFPNDSGLVGNQRITTCFSPLGDYLLLVSGADMAPGRTRVGIPLVFFTQGLGGFIQYSTKVLSGTPTQ